MDLPRVPQGSQISRPFSPRVHHPPCPLSLSLKRCSVIPSQGCPITKSDSGECHLSPTKTNVASWWRCVLVIQALLRNGIHHQTTVCELGYQNWSRAELSRVRLSSKTFQAKFVGGRRCATRACMVVLLDYQRRGTTGLQSQKDSSW